MAPCGWGATFEWSKNLDGAFEDPTKWTLVSGVGSAPPNIGDIALFNEPTGSYTVTLNSNSGPFAADVLRVVDGTVELAGAGFSPVLSIKTGGADVEVTGGSSLTVDGTAANLRLNIGDRLTVNDVSNLQVRQGADIDTNTLYLGRSSSETNFSRLTVEDTGSSLDVNTTSTTSIGLSGDKGLLYLLNNSGASFDGRLNLGVSGVNGSQGVVRVEGGATLTTSTVQVGGGSHAGASGLIEVIGLGSTLTQNGAASLIVGGASGGGTGRVEIENGASLSVGTGGTTIGATGVIIVDTTGTVDLGDLDYGQDVSLFNGQRIFYVDGDLEVNAPMALAPSGLMGNNLTLIGGEVTSNGTTLLGGQVRVNSAVDASRISRLIFNDTITGSNGDIDVNDGHLTINADATLDDTFIDAFGRFDPASGQRLNSLSIG
ncbi:MAG: autotransporter outer membrane beta-barrel domain-containing protein [Planctomycetota bacterium]